MYRRVREELWVSKLFLNMSGLSMTRELLPSVSVLILTGKDLSKIKSF